MLEMPNDKRAKIVMSNENRVTLQFTTTTVNDLDLDLDRYGLFDYDESRMTAFRPINEARDSCSHDKVIITVCKYNGYFTSGINN